MRWYLRFWWHNWRAHRWRRLARNAKVDLVTAETHQWHHESEWTAMKNALKDFKR